MSFESSLAVVGTDTGVGKTVVTAGLTAWLRGEGIAARAIKPAQTGYPEDDDAAFVAAACGIDDAVTCLERLEPPLAPAVAAEREGRELRYDDLLEGCRRVLSDAEYGLVEGIGGLRVPLAEGREVVDLVTDLDLPTLVVAHAGLGTLNHTALTVEALERRGVPVRGVILNGVDEDEDENGNEGGDLAERTNPATLRGMLDPGVPVETLPAFDPMTPGTAAARIPEELPRSFLRGETEGLNTTDGRDSL